MAWFWKFDLLLKTFQGPPLPSCLFNECKFLSLTFHLHISARAPNQWLSVLAVHWNYLGKFTINWCLDLTPKSSDVISLGCIENLKISLSDSNVQSRLRTTCLEQQVSSVNVYSNCLVQMQTLKLSRSEGDRVSFLRSRTTFCPSLSPKCTVKILSEYLKTTFLPTHSFPTFSSAQWSLCKLRPTSSWKNIHNHNQKAGIFFIHSFICLTNIYQVPFMARYWALG